MNRSYTFQITPLDHEDGGGYRISYPAFEGCHAYGETIEEAIKNGEQKVKEFLKDVNGTENHPPIGWTCS